MTIPARCSTCPVRSAALCGKISDDAANALSRVMHRVRIPAGRVIYGAVEQPNSFAILVSGVVKLVITKPDGRQQIVGLQFPSDFVGRPFADGSTLSAEAATTLELCCCSGRAFENVLRDYPELERALLKRLVSDLDGARNWAFLLGRTTAQEKVASLLYVIADRMARSVVRGCQERPCALGLSLPLSRMEMAECLGLRLETVCRQITQLKSRGVISTMGRRAFDVLDMHELKQCAANATAVLDEAV
ncbi:MAG: Crp/Fnr family transcriptional regulator [Hyphomicrobium zavarzinii]|jgi:CRP/FNR family transcriptional regulator|uniref:Crp/Fnr family transcriptional regulator n=1 Tax=Hyphomicrobium TaxID=81 RepID=UPI0003813291|nr:MULTISPECIES: Crp/Fnr family transcriptional regulator [Hyphomicrobium]MBL8847389.1 Crp/Fnr family transcriptional regulator [Hyphomicrobium zavarzinii]WBT37290.1 Crp/Fnr family transcriptional regulator [Hyphomicrobium sp. DMF-1]HML42228.1 Crp/Fnr family transcriptional regulator [Hyphomicrobium zavarzinii]